MSGLKLRCGCVVGVGPELTSTCRVHSPDQVALLRDEMAMRAPMPTEGAIKFEADADRMANPHGDTYKPARRSVLEIEWDLRYAWADAGVAARARVRR